MKRRPREYRQRLAEIGPETLKRPLLDHCNGINMGRKRVGKMSRDNIKARESKLGKKHEKGCEN